jgi:hypothetical protein
MCQSYTHDLRWKMKYAALDKALSMRGRAVHRVELNDAKISSGDLSVIHPRPRGVTLTANTARINGGPQDGAFAVVAYGRSYVDAAPGKTLCSTSATPTRAPHSRTFSG